MAQPTYSFIIPHYNVPTLLERCINSIPERDDIQIIVIDDGSELKPAKLRHNAEVIMLTEHTNAGNARNVGLSKAKGRWVLFPDADDFYNPGFLDILDKYAKSDNQVVFFSVNSCVSDTLEPSDRGESLDRAITDAYNGDKQALNYILFKRGNVCNMMISHEFINKYDFRFESAIINNDVLFHMNCCYHLERYNIISKQLYCISTRQGSLQNSKNTLDRHFAHLSNIVKRHRCLEYIGLPLRRPIWWNLFYGYDNKKYRKNKFQIFINRTVYRIKSIIELSTRWKELSANSTFYVEEIKRSTAYAQQHSNG